LGGVVKEHEYKSPDAFRIALQQRQRQRAAATGVPADRIAQTDLYFCFLDRVIKELGAGALVVKGGVALEMRLQRARTTRDIDLRVSGDPADIYKRIRAAGLREQKDFFTFRVEDPDGSSQIEGEGVIYEGRRFSVQAILANKPYLRRFGLDVAFGDAMVGEPDTLKAPDALSFIGVASPEIPIYPIGTHLAEKFHAYTLPRSDGRINSRMKDLVDIALVAVESALQPSPEIFASTVRESFEQTFAARKTHGIPRSVPPPPDDWATRYPRERQINQLPWGTIYDVCDEAARFLEPILLGTGIGAWSSQLRAWL
jgi:hypothetical protein